MNKSLSTILLLSITLLTVLPAYAQQAVSSVHAVRDASLSVPATQTQVIIRSSSDQVKAELFTGDQAVRTAEADGSYRYTMTRTLNEDETADGFCKTSVILELPEGKDTYSIVLRPGECYVGSFNPVNLLCTASPREIFPQEGTAKVSFTSELMQLTIAVDGVTYFSQGEPVTTDSSSPITPKANTEGNLKEYALLFTLTGDDSVSPTFTLSEDGEAGLTFSFSDYSDTFSSSTLSVKGSYPFSVSSRVKIVEKEVTYQEYMEQARQKEQELDFAGAMHNFEMAKNNPDFPEANTDQINADIERSGKAYRFLNYAADFERKAKRVEQEHGFSADSVYIYYRGMIRCYNRVLSLYPSATAYQDAKAAIEDHLKDHPKNNKTIRHQVVTGKHPRGGGIPIYRSYTSDKIKPKNDDPTLGTTGAGGAFRLVFKGTPPPYIYFYGDDQSYPIDSTTKEIHF